MTTHPNGGRPTPSRRTLVKGAAWAAPVIAVAAPAHAVGASQCVVQTTFDNLTVGTCVGFISFAPSLVTANVTYSSKPGNTCQVRRTTTNPAFSYVEVEMIPPRDGDFIDVTVTLSQPMENLSFTIHDIDSRQNGFLDQIIITTPGSTSQRGSTLTGDGSAGNPFRRNSWGDEPINSGAGAVKLTWAGPIQTATFRYRGGLTGNSANQHVALSRISFSDCLEGQQQRQAIVVPDAALGLADTAESADGEMRDL